MGELKLIVPKFVSITRSFAQKVNLANHVKGHDYESVDFFASHNREIPEELATPEETAKVSNELYLAAKAEVERSINDYLRSLKEDGGEVTAPTTEELAAISPFIAEVMAAKTAEAIESVSQKIAAVKETLSGAQLKFLRQLVLKAKNQ